MCTLHERVNADSDANCTAREKGGGMHVGVSTINPNDSLFTEVGYVYVHGLARSHARRLDTLRFTPLADRSRIG